MIISNNKPPLCIGNFGWEKITSKGKVSKKHPGGMGFRFVLIYSLLGVSCNYLAVVGKDKKWDSIFKKFEENGAHSLKTLKANKGINFIWKYKNDKLLSVDISNQEIMDKYPAIIKNIDFKKHSFILLGSLGYNNELKIIDQIKKTSTPVAYVFHETNLYKTAVKKYESLFKKINFLFLNKKESYLLTKEKNENEAGKALSKMAPYVFLTRDKNSTLVFNKGKKIVESKTINGKVINDSGAGDIFASSTMLGIYLTNDIKTACRYGTICSRLSLEDLFTNKLFNLI
jgi:sugar/nucleoside kinase (ribokinase family)